jgi:hypothetical protein
MVFAVIIWRDEPTPVFEFNVTMKDIELSELHIFVNLFTSPSEPVKEDMKVPGIAVGLDVTEFFIIGFEATEPLTPILTLIVK